MSMIKYFVCGAAILGMAASTVQAQVRIIDSQPVGRSQSSSSQPNTAQQANATPVAGQAELYYQMQLLQQEVQDLRGLVEQQSYELKQLKQQRLDDYIDLDRRIGQMSAAPATTNATAATASPSPVARQETVAQAEETAPMEELTSYRAAIDLVLKQRDFEGGITALRDHLQTFPSGHYAANAQYWLGQIYLQQNELPQSRDWFARMVKEHPNHQKAPEAKFKLGKVYHLLGDAEQAKKILEEVANANVAVASLAEDYLQQNF